MYSPNLLSQQPSYIYISPQKSAVHPTQFHYDLPSTQSSLPESFQQKLDFLNQKIDKQLKISAEIGIKASIISPFDGKFSQTNTQIPKSNTPDRFSSSKSISPHIRDTYVTKPKYISPGIKANIQEEENKLNLFNNLKERNEAVKYSNQSPKFKSNVKKNKSLLEKIQAIQDNLGIDVKALLDKMLEATEPEHSPHNPLKKLHEKKKSRITTPERHNSFIFEGNEENFKKYENKENIFQTPQKSCGSEKEEFEGKKTLEEEKIEKKAKDLKTELKMDINTGLNFLYDKVLEDVKDQEKKKPIIDDSTKKSIIIVDIKKESIVIGEELKIVSNKKESIITKSELDEKKKRDLMCEMKIDIMEGLNSIYGKVLDDVKVKEEEKNEKEKNENIGDVIKCELNILYDAIVLKK